MSEADAGTASPQPSTPHSPPGDQWDGPSPEEVIARRSGDVLLRHTILKGDHFPGCQNMRLRPLVDGAPNYRAVPGLPVYGVAIPTVSGVRRVLDLMGAARGARRVLWHSLREEPVVYVNGAPFVVREADKPFANLEYTGIDRERVEGMEARLKLDVLQEAQRYGNQILVAEEDDQFQVVHTWQPVSEADVQTPAEVYRELAEDGYDVDYLRVPVTDEKAPKGRDFDTLIRRCWRPPAGTALVFNCQMGRGRTTTGMVIGSLLALRAALAQRDAPPVSFWDGLPAAPLGEGLPDWFQAGSSSASDTPVSEPDLEAELQAGNWGAVRSLVRVLEGAGPSKVVLDVVVDACAAMQNLRVAIASYRDRVARERNDGRRSALLAVAAEYLERYFGLIAFATYMGAPGFDPERSFRGGGFARWASARPELGSILSRLLRMNPLTALALSKRRVGKASSADSGNGDGNAGPTIVVPPPPSPDGDGNGDPLTPRLSPEEEEIAAHRAARCGSVLGPRTLLKQDHAPGCQSDRVPSLIPGAPNLRELKGMRVWGGALPTVEGMRGVLDLVGAGPTAAPSKQCHAVWTLMREEPMVYLNGAPYVLRESSRPFKNLMEYRGIGPERLEDMEERLRADVQEEAGARGGRVLVTREEEEEPEGGRSLRDELLPLQNCATPRAVARALRGAGYRVTLVRLPITDGSAPRVSDLDAFYSTVAGADPADALVYTCQLGGGRTTLGMVIGGLLRRAINGAVLGAPDALPNAVVQLDEDVGDPEPPPLFMHQSLTSALPGGADADAGLASRRDPGAAKNSALPDSDVAELQEEEEPGIVTIAASDDEQVEYRVPDAEAEHLLAGGPLSPSASITRRAGSITIAGTTPFARAASATPLVRGPCPTPFGTAASASTPLGRGGSAGGGTPRRGSLPPPLGRGGDGTLADQEQANLWAGEYKAVRRLVRTLERGGEAKAVVDGVVDAAGTLINLRASIQRYRVPRSLDRFYRPEVQARHAAFARGGRALERYCLLIALAAYLQQCREHGRRVSFAGWWASRPDVRAAVEWIHADPASALAPVPGVASSAPSNALAVTASTAGALAGGPGTITPGHPGPVPSAEERAVLRKRRGAVVGRRTILKSLPAAFPGAGPSPGPGGAALPGVTDLRRVAGWPVYTLGNASVAGLRALLTALATEHAGARVVVTDLREELVLYVAGTQYVRREVEAPAAAAHHAGVHGARLEALERQLRSDVMAEASAWGGHLLLHREVARTNGRDAHVGEATARGQTAATGAEPTLPAGAQLPAAPAAADNGKRKAEPRHRDHAPNPDDATAVGDRHDPVSKRPRLHTEDGADPEATGDAVVFRFAAAHGLQNCPVGEAREGHSGTLSGTLPHVLVPGPKNGTLPGAEPDARPPSRGEDDITQSTQYQSRTEVQAFWVRAGSAGDVDAGVCTAAEVFAALASEGVRVTYRRVPLSRERTPAAADLDALSARLTAGYSTAGAGGGQASVTAPPRPVVHVILGRSATGSSQRFAAALFAAVLARLSAEAGVVPGGGRVGVGAAGLLQGAGMAVPRLPGVLGFDDDGLARDGSGGISAGARGPYLSPLGGGSGMGFAGPPPLPALATRRLTGGVSPLGGSSPLAGPGHAALHRISSEASELSRSVAAGEYRGIMNLCRVMRGGADAKAAADAAIDACAEVGDLRADIAECAAAAAPPGSMSALVEPAATSAGPAGTPAGTPSPAEARRLGLHYLQRYFLLIAFMGYMAAVPPPRDASFSQWMGERREQKYLLSTLELE